MKLLFSPTIIFFLTALSASAAEWTTFRGGMERTGYYDEAIGFPAEEPLWEASLGCEIISSPVIAEGILYLGARDSALHAFDAATGDKLWEFKSKGWIDATPLVADGRIIASSRDGKMYVLDAVSGKLLFTRTAGVQLSSPALAKSGLVVSGLGPPYNAFGAYDLSTPVQDPRWRYDFSQMSYSSPCVFGQMAVVGANDGRMYGFDIASGDTAWSVKTAGGIYMSTPATDGVHAFFAPGNYDRYVYCVDLVTGETIWRNGVLISSPAVAKLAKSAHLRPISSLQFRELLRYSPEHRRAISARLRAKGLLVPDVLTTGLAKSRKAQEEQWYPYGGMKTSSVALDKKSVYVVQKELGYPNPRFSLVAFDKVTGQSRWNFTETRTSERLGYCSSPVVTRNAVYVGWGEGMLYAVNPETGEELWSDTLDGTVISSPAIANNKLYVATMNGKVYSYSLAETAPGLDFKRSTYCYPNPARGSVSNLQVYVNEVAQMEMVVYNVADKPILRVKRTLDGKEKYVYAWDLANVANGVYLARIKVTYKVSGKEERKTVKIAVLR